MPTVTANKGIFDYSNSLDKTKQDAAKYGIQDPGAGLYADLADQSRAPGYGAQMEALAMYRNGALGQSDSVAQRMLNQQTSANARGGLQMAAQGRGGNLAGMQSQAMAQTAGGQAQAAQAGATLRAQEMQANQAAYAGLAGQMYGQGFGYDQLASQTGLGANQQMIDWQMGTRQLDMQRDQNKFARNMGIANAAIGGVSAIGDVVGGIGGASDERLKIGVKTIDPFVDGNPYAPDADVPFVDRMNEQRQNRGSNPGGWNIPAGSGGFVPPATNFRYAESDDSAQEAALAETSSNTKLGETAAKMGMTSNGMVAQPGQPGQEPTGFEKLGMAFGGNLDFGGNGGGAGGFSDERLKQGAQPAAGGQISATQTLDAVKPASFEYAPGAGPPGRRVGVMAQDLEKTPAGAAIVKNTPQGKMVDTFGASTLALAGQAEARQREKSLEARLARLEGGGQAQPVGFAPPANPDVTMTPSLTPAQIDEKRQRSAAERGAQTLLYKPSSAKASALGRGGEGGVKSGLPQKLSPEQQQMLDDFQDELDKWTYIDETGARRIGAVRRDFSPLTRGARRDLDKMGDEVVEKKMPKPLKKSKSEGML